MALALIPPLLATKVLPRGADNAWGNDRILEFMAFVKPQHAGHLRACSNRSPMGSQAPECSWHVEAAGKPVYLVADSHADHFIEGLIGVTEQEQPPLFSATTNGCPFIDMTFVDTRPKQQAANELCANYVSGSLAWLDTAKPGTVVISNSGAYFNDPTFELAVPGDNPTADSEAKAEVFRSQLGATVTRLEGAGHRAIVLQSVPRWVGSSAWRPDACPAVVIAADRCQASMSVDEALTRQATEREALVSSVASTGARVWDPWPEMCPDGICRTQQFGIVRYRDPGHITVAESERLAPALSEMLRSAA